MEHDIIQQRDCPSETGTMTFDQLDFATFCIGCVSDSLHLNQRDVYDKLYESGILDGYIVKAYPYLHTLSSENITKELIDCMKFKGVLE